MSEQFLYMGRDVYSMSKEELIGCLKQTARVHIREADILRVQSAISCSLSLAELLVDMRDMLTRYGFVVEGPEREKVRHDR